MKRTLSLMLALVMAVSLMACGKKDDGKNNADAPADSLALLTKVWDSYTDDEKFPAAGGDYENPVEDAPGAVSIADADNLNYMLTLPVVNTFRDKFTATYSDSTIAYDEAIL